MNDSYDDDITELRAIARHQQRQHRAYLSAPDCRDPDHLGCSSCMGEDEDSNSGEDEHELGCSHCGWNGRVADARKVVPLGHPIAHHECPKCGKFCTDFYVSLEPLSEAKDVRHTANDSGDRALLAAQCGKEGK